MAVVAVVVDSFRVFLVSFRMLLVMVLVLVLVGCSHVFCNGFGRLFVCFW